MVWPGAGHASRRPATVSVPGCQLKHFAISAEGLGTFLAHLRAQKVAYKCGVLPEMGIQQVNINDHDGNHIHIDFAPGEEADLTDYNGT